MIRHEAVRKNVKGAFGGSTQDFAQDDGHDAHVLEVTAATEGAEGQ
jgi:hypothetical protein